MKGALLRYRVLSTIVGVLLVLLVPIGLPLKYAADKPGLVSVVGFIHGMFYIVYVIVAFDLARRARFSLGRTVIMFLAGLVPFATFVVEARVTREVNALA